jgi:DNA polymerase III delta prime subunit
MAGTAEWTSKYEPKRLEDMILHPGIKDKLSNALRTYPNMILFCPPGMGKGTFTNIFLEETGFDNMWINASNENGVDVIRNRVGPFVTSGSVKEFFSYDESRASLKVNNANLNVVVFNEADYLTPEAQASLRQLMEDVGKFSRFIFMTNNINRIEDAIKSRCMEVEFKDPPIEEILAFMERILNNENIQYDGGILATFVQNQYPDIRKTINEIKSHCVEGRLLSGETTSIERMLNRILIDLRLYMAFYNIDRREIYGRIKDVLEEPVSERQFYYLLKDNGTKNVRERKKVVVVKAIQENLPYKQWLHDYMKLDE